MSQEPPAKRVRKGTKSCTECRHRKIRCIWPSERAARCQSCDAHRRTCELQVHATPTSDTPIITSRARITHLENEVSSLRAAVRNLENTRGCEPLTPQRELEISSDGAQQDRDDSDVDYLEVSSTNPPTHLLQLFDNDVLSSDSPATMPRHALDSNRAQGSAALRALLPSREDLLTITTHASSWLYLYHLLFPTVALTQNSDETMSQYDTLQDPNSDPIAIAALLLSIAITVLQAPDDTIGCAVKSIGVTSSFVKEVSDTVERIVVSDDASAGTLEGIETTLLFVRLQLGRAKPKKMWLLLRRVIALADLSGLSKAPQVTRSDPQMLTSTSPEGNNRTPVLENRKAAVWEAICALDRIVSMMWSLPLATAHRLLPKRSVTDSEGQVLPQSFLYELADIASRVLELDKIRSSGGSLLELSNAAMGVDQELRILTVVTPRKWWRMNRSELSVDALLQYWHQYFTVRTHLQLALSYDFVKEQQYAFNFIACLDACKELASRYITLRPILPAGFFANWIIDLQAFTPVVVLLLTTYRNSRSLESLPQPVDVGIIMDLVNEVVRIMESAAHRIQGQDFTRQATTAIRSLSSLLLQPSTSQAQKTTLNLPLVGRIHVSRRSQAMEAMPQQARSEVVISPLRAWQPISNLYTSSAQATPSLNPSNDDLINSLCFSMEVSENFLSLNDDIFTNEQWLN